MRPVWTVLLAFPVVFAAIWSSVTWLTAALGGWRALAAPYADAQPWTGPRLPHRNAWMGWWGYGWSMTLGADRDALHLSVMAPFRVGHPPLRIPLDEIEVREESWILGRRAVYRFRRAPRVRFRTSVDLARRLGRMTGGRLRLESGETTPSTSSDRPGTTPGPAR